MKRSNAAPCDETVKKTDLSTTKRIGAAAEQQALEFLQAQGLRQLRKNYRTPGRGGGEIDLIMQTPDATTEFVKVRNRASDGHGGAGDSVTHVKRRRIIFAARHYLLSLRTPPACRFSPVCRFDMVLLGPNGMEWLQAAFDAG